MSAPNTRMQHDIQAMIDEERELRARGSADFDAQNRLERLEGELTKCWQLLQERSKYLPEMEAEAVRYTPEGRAPAT